MPKSKQKKFSKVSAVKSNARDRVGMPKASFVLTPKNKRSPRYKTSWNTILDEEEEFELYPDDEELYGNVRIK